MEDTYGEEICRCNKTNKVFLDTLLQRYSVGEHRRLFVGGPNVEYISYVSTICVGLILGVVGSVDVVDEVWCIIKKTATSTPMITYAWLPPRLPQSDKPI